MGGAMACGLSSDGRVQCWSDPECRDRTPTTESFTEIEVGQFNACGLRPDGSIGCWCCFDSSDYTCRAPPPAGSFARLEVGSYYACAQDAAGYLQCWGFPGMTNLGPPPQGPVRDVDIDASTIAAVLADGSLYIWGEFLGWEIDGVVAGPPTDVTFTRVGVGRRHGCGVDVDGQGHCWGYSWNGTPFPEAPPGTFVDVESFNEASCFLDSNGRATCVWGDSSFDDPTFGWPPPDEAWAQLGLGEWDGCGTTLDGRGLCWGQDNWGELQVPELAP